MAKIIEKLEVEYVKVVNGVSTKHKCRLEDLLKDEMAEERANIVSLAVLSVVNKDGTLYSQAEDISKHIMGFPMLTTLAYPAQFPKIDVAKIQSTCPNLNKIIRTISNSYTKENVPDLSFVSSKKTPVTIKAYGNTDEDMASYGHILGEGHESYSIISVDPKTPTTPTSSKSSSKSRKKTFITESDLLGAISSLGDRLDAIERKVNQGNNSQITKTKIQNILKNFVGKITQEHLDSIIAEIKMGVDVNISIETMEQLGKNIDESIKKAFTQIYAETKGQENENYKKLLTEMSEIKKNTASEAEAQAEMLKILKEKLPGLIATNKALTNKIFVELGIINAELTKEGGINDQLGDISGKIEDLDVFATLCIEELGNIHGLISGLATPDDVKTAVREVFNELASEITNGNKEIFEKIGKAISGIPTIDNIKQIADDSLQKVYEAIGWNVNANAVINSYLSDSIVSRVIQAMGDVTKLDATDFLNIENLVNQVIQGETFKTTVAQILKDENLAKVSDITDLKTLFSEQLQTLSLSMNGFSAKLDGLASKDDIKSVISRDENGDYLGLIPDYIREKLPAMLRDELTKAGIVTKDQLKDFVSTNPDMIQLIQNVNQVMALIQNNGGVNVTNNTTNNNTTNNYYTQGNNEADNAEENPSVVNNITNIDINQLIQTLQTSIASATTLSVIMNSLAQLNVSNRITVGGVQQPDYSGMLALVTALLSGRATSSDTTIDNTQIVNLLQLVIKNLGIIPPQVSNPDYDKLKAELGALKLKHQQDTDELKKLIKDLTDALKAREGKTDPTPDPKPAPTLDPKTDPNKGVKPTPLPEPTGVKKLVRGTIKNLEKLKEPKLPWHKRLRKFIVRHPLRAAAIGLGIGALGAVGVALGGSLIATGGIAAAVNTANLFLPTIGIGAGIGAGATLVGAGIGAIVSRFSRKGRKERLYTKFLKQKAKCDAMAEKLEEKYEAQKAREAAIEELKEKQKTGNKLLKKLGVYKHAKKVNRKKLRKLKAKTRETERKRKAKVYDALNTKRDLNAMENADNKTLAMGGHLQRLRDTKEKLENDLRTARTADDREEIMDEIQDAFEDAEDEVEGISQLADEYQTFDEEAEELIESVKGEKTDTMKDILNDIQTRNSRRYLHTEDRPDFDAKTVQEYLEKVKDSKNPEDINNAQKIQQYMEDLKKEKTDLGTLVREGKISPMLANILAKQGQVDLPSGEVVTGIPFEVEKAPEDNGNEM